MSSDEMESYEESMSIEENKSSQEKMSVEEGKSNEEIMSVEEGKSNGENMSVEEGKSNGENMSVEEMESSMSIEEIPTPLNAYKDRWKLHDLYKTGVSSRRILTRSQTGFLRIKNTESDLELFANKKYHQPKSMKHVIETMKGKYGAIPRTNITRRSTKYLKVSSKLTCELEKYKSEMRRKIAERESRKSRDELITKSRDGLIRKSRDELVRKSRDELIRKSRDELIGKSKDELLRINGDEPIRQRGNTTLLKNVEKINEADDFYTSRRKSIPTDGSPEVKLSTEESNTSFVDALEELPAKVRKQSSDDDDVFDSFDEDEDDTTAAEPEEKPRGILGYMFWKT